MSLILISKSYKKWPKMAKTKKAWTEKHIYAFSQAKA